MTVTEIHATEEMNAVDRAWLEMDRQHNPMIMVGILELRSELPIEKVAGVLVERLLENPRFSQVADDRTMPALWRPCGEPDWSYHVHIHALSETRSRRALIDAIHRDLGFGLDHRRPLWRVSFFRLTGGGIIALFRAHHAIADGVAMLRQLRRLDDRVAAGVLPADRINNPSLPHEGPLTSLIHRLEAFNALVLGARKWVSGELKHPEHLHAQVNLGGEVAAATLRVLSLPENNPSCLTGPLSGTRRVSWAPGVPVQRMREVAHRDGVTVNDLLLAALSRVFRQELRDLGQALTKDQIVRVAIPVSLREEEDGQSGNQFGLVMLDLPVGEPSKKKQLELIAGQMRELKHSQEARAVLLSLGIAGRLPAAAEHRLIDLVANKSVAVVSNLPGPDQALVIGESRLENMTFFPPQAGHIGIGISLLSYAGQLTVGVSADRNRLPDVSRFVRRLRSQLRTICKAVRL